MNFNKRGALGALGFVALSIPLMILNQNFTKGSNLNYNFSALPNVPTNFNDSSCIPQGVNASGNLVVGICGNGQYEGVYWTQNENLSGWNSVILPANLPGPITIGYSQGLYMNGHSQIAGTYLVPGQDGKRAAFFLDSPTSTQAQMIPPLPEAGDCFATGINQAGEVIGSCQSENAMVAFSWTQAKGIRPLPTPQGPNFGYLALAVNSSGAILLSALSGTNYNYSIVDSADQVINLGSTCAGNNLFEITTLADDFSFGGSCHLNSQNGRTTQVATQSQPGGPITYINTSFKTGQGTNAVVVSMENATTGLITANPSDQNYIFSQGQVFNLSSSLPVSAVAPSMVEMTSQGFILGRASIEQSTVAFIMIPQSN